MNLWDPTKDDEPPGWSRHPPTNRYRVQCDPTREFNLDDPPPPGFRHPFSLENGWTPIAGEEA